MQAKLSQVDSHREMQKCQMERRRGTGVRKTRMKRKCSNGGQGLKTVTTLILVFGIIIRAKEEVR